MRLAFVLTTSILLGSTAHSQSADDTAEIDPFEAAIDVRVVNIEAVVTARDGQRVSGLTAEDFALEVDGQKTSIDFFTEISGGKISRDQISGDPANRNLPSGATPGQTLPTNLLIFIDDALTLSQDRNRVLRSLQSQLGSILPTPNVALVAFDGRALASLTSWTDNVEKISAALSQAMERHAYGALRSGDLRAMDSWSRDRQVLEREQQILMEGSASRGDGASAGDPGPGSIVTDGAFDREPSADVLNGTFSGPDLATAHRLTNIVGDGVAASVHALRTSAAPHGRKILLMLLGDWPLSPAGYVASGLGSRRVDLATAATDPKFSGSLDLFEPLVEAANLVGFTIYTADVSTGSPGASLDPSDSPNQFELDDANSGAGGITQDREFNVHAALRHLADETGGLAFLEAQAEDAIAVTFQDSRDFYWIGFSPKETESDTAHRVIISIPGRPDLTIRNRTSFVDRASEAAGDMAIESALHFDSPTVATPSNTRSTKDQLELRLGSPDKAGARKLQLKIEVGIPMETITLLESQGRFTGRLEVRFLLEDNQGNRSPIARDEIPIDGSQPPSPGQQLWYETQLTLRPRDHRIVVTVTDTLAGTTLTGSVDFSP